jgi:hypothetical protein
MTRPPRFAAALCALGAACATPVATSTPEHPRHTELRQFQGLQQVFREQNTTPQQFDFADKSRVTVDDVSLDGWPGNAYVRCRFSYQNRTEKPVVQSWVSLDVLDQDGALVASETTRLILPIPYPIARGSYFADELRTATLGTHLQPGWSWRIRCTSIAEELEEPLDPPVLERVAYQPPPMWIKHRGGPPSHPASVSLFGPDLTTGEEPTAADGPASSAADGTSAGQRR